jgi:hypothetical protein
MKSVLSKFNFEFITFKPFLDVRKDIINEIFKLVTVRMINNDIIMISEEYRLGL